MFMQVSWGYQHESVSLFHLIESMLSERCFGFDILITSYLGSLLPFLFPAYIKSSLMLTHLYLYYTFLKYLYFLMDTNSTIWQITFFLILSHIFLFDYTSTHPLLHSHLSFEHVFHPLHLQYFTISNAYASYYTQLHQQFSISSIVLWSYKLIIFCLSSL